MQLSETPLFRGMSEDDVEQLLTCLGAVRRSYKKGETILAEGQPAESVGVVLSGRVLIACADVWGGNSVLGHAGPGEVFAEAYACVPGEPLLISVQAAEDTAVLFLRVGRVLTTCSSACAFHAALVRNLLTVCAQKNLALSRRILHTGPKSIRGRLMSYFSECAKKAGSGVFELPYTRQQLADYLGVDRSAMCSELSAMRRDGLIRCEKRRVEICEMPVF